ncbi:MAG: 3-phosphoshikimate 1-carboxyvinyltransferase [Verrucomicrobia bacterium]|nr:3-phosphoshikimate 1-carboxyvinyltransferase [Verrucomicrobiota bacterium]MBU1910119.1 3-phosphoshikimate 1-carboxyvinyltransferase [Verrucomicrobiota bacterium]
MVPKSQSVLIHPAKRLGGVLTMPGDKSISHRVAILAATAKGSSTVLNYLQSEDCLNTLHAMERLGARSFFSEEGELTIQGTGGKFLEPVDALDLGNSGTGMRLLAGLLAGLRMKAELTGDQSLCSRPMNRIKEPLEKMGATIELLGDNGRPPIRIQGGGLKGIDYAIPVASAQVKSCILLATLFAGGTTTITEVLPTRDHTERCLRAAGVPLKSEGLRIQMAGCGPKGPRLKARTWAVPGDFSSAAYALAAAAARPDSTVTVKNVGLNPRRTALLQVLERMNARIQVNDRSGPDDAEPFGDVTISGSRLTATEVGGAEIPAMIDELPLVAILGALAEGETVIRDARELRVKESDRIACMAANLKLLGVDVEEREDGMAIRGPARLEPVAGIRSYSDHRIAMSLAVLGTYGVGPVCIHNVACVQTSYPAFWDHLIALGAHVE